MRRLLVPLLVALLAGALLPGCTGAGSWAEFSKSGGIANSKLSVVIDKSGKVTTTSASGTKVTDLSQAQKDALTALLAENPAAPSSPSSGVRDAFAYELRSDASRVSWNDADETPQLAQVREFFEGVASV